MASVPRKMQSRASRNIFSASDDTTMTKHILATHAPVSEYIEVRPLLNVVQDIFDRAASLIPAIVQVYMRVTLELIKFGYMYMLYGYAGTIIVLDHTLVSPIYLHFDS